MNRSTAVSRRHASGAEARGRLLPIDMAHLAKQTLGDRNLELEVLRLFDEMLDVYFGRIERATTRAELMMHIHNLKGAAAGVGARSVADLAGVAETELRDGLPVNPERIDDIGMAVAECRAYVGSILVAADDAEIA